MSIVRVTQITGPASAAGTLIGSQLTPVEGAAFAEVALPAIPPGGAQLSVQANGGAPIRVAVIPREHPQVPPSNGGLIVKTGDTFVDLVPQGSRLWTRLL